jgi:hypothetical protein
LILFAGFFIEANLNYIVEELHMSGQMESFLYNKAYPHVHFYGFSTPYIFSGIE